MKANEAPEKLYVNTYDHLSRNGFYASTEKYLEDSVEYVHVDALEVKEVDLEKEMDKYYGMYRDEEGKTHDIEDGEVCFDWRKETTAQVDMRLAKHFFELGLKAQKG